jgi:hypothetical protein
MAQTVRDVMTQNVVTLPRTTPVRQLEEICSHEVVTVGLADISAAESNI